jgi:hypothetical protein
MQKQWAVQHTLFDKHKRTGQYCENIRVRQWDEACGGVSMGVWEYVSIKL